MAVETSESPPLATPIGPGRAADPASWLVFLVYAALLAVASLRHEPWGDELHSWNIAKASGGVVDLLGNIRYEGHPPLWYVILWSVSKVSHSLVGMRLAQYLLACAAAGLIVFRAPFPLPARALIPFGYYFLFEYGVLSRNYAIGVVLALAICAVDDARPRPARRAWRAPALRYLLLFLLANVHLCACLLAAALHASDVVERWRRAGRVDRGVTAHALAGALVIAPTLGFIFPPSDSQLGASFWLHRWSLAQLGYVALAPVKALLPLPAWWRHHFWNSHFLVDLGGPRLVGRGLGLAASAAVLGAAVFVLRHSRRGLVLLVANLFLTGLAGLFFPLTSARYVGFVFIGFLAACWLSQASRPLDRRRQRVLTALLAAQVAGGLFAVGRDVRVPFSNASRVVDLAAAVPPGADTVTDYWCLDNLAAYLDRPFYVLQRQDQVSLLKWDAGFLTIKEVSAGLERFRATHAAATVFMYSSRSPAALRAADPRLFELFDVAVVRAFEGAIEPTSDVYLYRIAPSSS